MNLLAPSLASTGRSEVKELRGPPQSFCLFYPLQSLASTKSYTHPPSLLRPVDDQYSSFWHRDSLPSSTEQDQLRFAELWIQDTFVWYISFDFYWTNCGIKSIVLCSIRRSFRIRIRPLKMIFYRGIGRNLLGTGAIVNRRQAIRYVYLIK